MIKIRYTACTYIHITQNLAADLVLGNPVLVPQCCRRTNNYVTLGSKRFIILLIDKPQWITPMKLCKICNQEKPYDATSNKDSKASGFYGASCWTCYLATNAKAANTKRRSTPEGQAKANAANLKLRATPEGHDKACAAARSYAKKCPGKVNAKNMAYYTSKLRRIPPWANLDAIKQVYTEAAQQKLTAILCKEWLITPRCHTICSNQRSQVMEHQLRS